MKPLEQGVDKTMPQDSTNTNTDALLEHILESEDTNSKHTHSLLENILEQGSKETSTDSLLENSLELQDKALSKLDEIKSVLEKPEEPQKEIDLLPIIDNMKEIATTFSIGVAEIKAEMGKTHTVTLEII